MMPWTDRPIALDSRLLLAFNIVIPLTIVVIALDYLVWGGAIKAFLPSKPEDYLWFAFVFNFPHIMGSMVTYADKEYMAAYKRPLVTGSALCLFGSLAAIMIVGMNAFFIFVGFYTIYHLLMQQYGVALMFARRRPDTAYQIWRWVSVAAGGFLYLDVYRPDALAAYTSLTIKDLSIILTVACMPFGAWFFRQIAKAPEVSRTTKIYFLATFAIIPATCVACIAGYPFLLVIIPRFIHDATAFAVYAVHDHNRNLTTKHNVIYRVLAPLHVSPAILCIPLAIGLSWYLTANQYESVPVMGFLLFFALLHYYMEAYMWKREAPHRKNVAFKIV